MKAVMYRMPGRAGTEETIMNKHIRQLALILALLFTAVFITGCAAPSNNNTTEAPDQGGVNTAVGIRPAVGSGNKVAGDVEAAYITAMNSFSAAMLRNMGDGWTGVVSPVSFAMMLELLANGGAPDVQNELLTALMTDIGMKPTNENAARLIAALEKSFSDITGEESRTDEGERKQCGTIKLLSAILVAEGDKFSAVFEGNAADYYNASVGNVDFRNTEEAIKAVNGWISENTNGLIPNLFDDIAPDTTMALLNALYFRGDWAKPFTLFRDQSAFHGLNGEVMVSMLRSTDEYRYAEIDGNQVVLIPYADSSCYMAVVLPAKDTTPTEALAGAIGLFDTCVKAPVELTMPSITLKTKFDAMPLLSKLGLPGIQSGETLFTGIVEGGTIRLTQFIHAATLNITEYGTEASAATGVTGTKNAGTVFPGEVHIMSCDRPYAMAIIDGSTGAVLFASIVNDIPA